MQTTDSNYDAKIIAQTELREWEAKVIYRQVDITAKPDCTVTANEWKSESQETYVIDKLITPLYNYATLEPDRWLLDGGFALAPDSATISDIDGMNDNLSDESTYIFSTPWELTFQFTADHSSSGFTVIFNILNGEWAKDFTIKYYDSLDVLMDTITVTDNTDITFVDDTAIEDYRKIVLNITKWSQGNRIARVAEVYFGQVKEFTKLNGKLLKLKINEALDLISRNIVSNSLTFDIDNILQEYNPINPDGIYSYIVPRQEIETYLALKTATDTYKYINTGRFYLENLVSNSDNISATINAKGLLHFLSLNMYKKGTYASHDMKTLAESILADAGLSSDQYDIDTSLSSITMTTYMPILTHKEALQAIAIASSSVLYEDRDGKVIIKPLTKTAIGYDITRNNQFQVPKIETDRALKEVTVTSNTLTLDASDSEVGKATLNLNGTYDVEINYTSPADDVSASLSLGSINSETYYANYCVLNITSTGLTTITLEGKKINTTTNIVRQLTGNSDGETIDINIPIITDESVASDVASWIVAEKLYLNNLNVNWRQNPAFELGDVIDNTETQFEDQENAVILENEFVFTGALKGRSLLKGTN